MGGVSLAVLLGALAAGAITSRLVGPARAGRAAAIGMGIAAASGAAGVLLALGGADVTWRIGSVAIGTEAEVGVRLDAVGGAVTLLALLVGAVVRRSLAVALRDDHRLPTAMGALLATTAAAVVAATGTSLLVLAVGWIAVGPPLALLVALPETADARRAAHRLRRTFLLGDVALVAGVVVLALALPSLDHDRLAESLAGPLRGPLGDWSASAVTATAGLLALMAAVCRSALIPARGWLDATIAGPTPVSALLHAGIVNGAGLLLIRALPLLDEAPVVRWSVVVAGAVSALAGTVAMLTRPDIKGALVRSTSGQMGFMVLEIGLGVPGAALVHLVAHGTFKATLFLDTGGVTRRAKADRDAPSCPPAVEGPALVARTAVPLLLAVVIATGAVWSAGLEPWSHGGSLLVVAAAAVAVVVIVRAAAAARPLGIGMLAGLGVAAGAVLAIQLLVEDRTADGLLPGSAHTALPAPPAAVVLALVSTAVLASVVVAAGRGGRVAADRWWVWARFGPRPHVAPPPDPVPGTSGLDEEERARLRIRVAAAGEALPPVFPLPGFIAANPLLGAEDRSWDEALEQRRLDGSPSHVAESWYRDRYAAGFISDATLDAAVERHAPGPHAPIEVGGRSFTAGMLRRLALTGPDPAPSSVAAAARQLADLDGSPEPGGSVATGPELVTAAELVDRVAGTALTGAIDDEIAAWTASHLDQGEASWMPSRREEGFWSTWRRLARFRVPSRSWGGAAIADAARRAPERPEDAIARSLAGLGVERRDERAYLARSLLRLPGWSALVANRAAHPERWPVHSPPVDLVEVLAVRLTIEAAAVRTVTARLGLPGTVPALVAARPGIEPRRSPTTPEPSLPALVARVLAALPAGSIDPGAEPRRSPLVGHLVEVLQGLDHDTRSRIWHDAVESAERRRLAADLEAGRQRLGQETPPVRPRYQTVLCIDVRSEALRRHLEADAGHQTLGFAGFFGVALRHVAPGAVDGTARCPAILAPRTTLAEVPGAGAEAAFARSLAGARTGRALHHAVLAAEEHPVAALALVEAAGWLWGVDLVLRGLLPRTADRLRARVRRRLVPPAPTRIGLAETGSAEEPRGLGFEEQVFTAETALRLMGLTSGMARLVLLAGHASTTENNPHESSLDCGACGGNPGGFNARALVALLNDSAVRKSLAERGIHVPVDTWFVAGEHDTTTDRVTLLDPDTVPTSHRGDITRLRHELAAAATMTSLERCTALPGALASSPERAAAAVHARAVDWAELRPEWGLAGNQAIVVGPRVLTEQATLGRRCFLHSYEWSADPDGQSLLTILSGPLVVAEWINLQYYFSTVDPVGAGAGSKLVHNGVGRIGVLTADRGDARAGLPLESVARPSTHGPFQPEHLPVRLLAVVVAPRTRVDQVLDAAPAVARLVANEWIGLVVLDPVDRSWWRATPGPSRSWEPWEDALPGDHHDAAVADPRTPEEVVPWLDRA